MVDPQVNLAKQAIAHQVWAYPCVMDLRAEFLIDNKDDLILYPTFENNELFQIMGVFKRLKEKHFKPQAIGINLAYGTRSIFYGHSLIELDVKTETTKLYGLSTLGRSAAASLAQGHVWSSHQGIRKDLTRDYYARIMAGDYADVAVPASRVNFQAVRRQTSNSNIYLTWPEIEWLAQTEVCNQSNFGKEFKREVMLRKLQRG